MRSKSVYRIVIILSLSLLTVLIANAQPGNPNEPDVPITGIEILIALGGLLGIKKLYGSKRKSN